MQRIPSVVMTALVIYLFTCVAANAAWIDYDNGQVDPGSTYTMRFPHYWWGIEVRLGEHLLDFESVEGKAEGIFKNVPSYCIEDQDALTKPLEYAMRTVGAHSADRDKRAAWIYKEYGSFFNEGVSDKQKKYNQAAIWNVFMDDDYSLGKGGVKVLESGWSGYKLINGADEILKALYDFETAYGFDDYDFSGVLIASNPFSQDFITADLWPAPSEVPVPGAAWLLGSGLLGLAGLRLRRGR